jgi:hypothetical protein
MERMRNLGRAENVQGNRFASMNNVAAKGLNFSGGGALIWIEEVSGETRRYLPMCEVGAAAICS